MTTGLTIMIIRRDRDDDMARVAVVAAVRSYFVVVILDTVIHFAV